MNDTTDFPDITIFEKFRIFMGVLLLKFGVLFVQFGIYCTDDRWLKGGELIARINRLSLEKEYGKDGLALIEGFHDAYLSQEDNTNV